MRTLFVVVVVAAVAVAAAPVADACDALMRPKKGPDAGPFLLAQALGAVRGSEVRPVVVVFPP